MDTSDDDPDGEGPEPVPSRSDLRLMAQAIKQRWPMSDTVRVQVLKRLTRILDDDAWDGEHFELRPSHREVIAAARALLDADKLNMEQEKRDQQIPDRVVHEHHFAQLSDDELIARAAELARRAGQPGPAPAG